MYHVQHRELVAARQSQLRTARAPEGLRRSSRLIQLDIRRQRRAGHRR